MNPSADQLPPTWIKAFSWLFLIFLAAPVLGILQIGNSGAELSIAAFGLTLRAGENSTAWIIGIHIVLFAGGLTGLFILRRRRFAYDFGISYCFLALLVTAAGHLFHAGETSGINMAIQYPLLLLFLWHLIAHRREWIRRHGWRAVEGHSLKPMPHTSL